MAQLPWEHGEKPHQQHLQRVGVALIKLGAVAQGSADLIEHGIAETNIQSGLLR